MTDTSDCESDAGASPSVSSDESANSSSSGLSLPALKIVCSSVETQSTTPKKRVRVSTASSITPVASTSAASVSTPVSTGRRPRRKQICVSSPASNHTTPSKITSGRESVSDTNIISSGRKRKRQPPQVVTPPEQQVSLLFDPRLSPETKRKRNKRRRTRSERNIRAGKASITDKAPIVAEGEVAVALDAEIDKVLEEKAIKNNLSATNVKSIIRHVITNNMVQKMIMSAMRKKAEVGDGVGGGGSSDEDGLVEPKMTRAKTKELLGNKQTPLWPIVDSPVKMKKQPVSETQMLIHHDLPEDSSGDEEYVPIDAEVAHSDDESGSLASAASDAGSPALFTGVSTRRSLQAVKTSVSDPLFKTPPPRLRSGKARDESAISRRTRSKHPLNDTPLEDLERQLVPPDITNDMYDWGQTDNEDYLTFLKEFLFPGQNAGNDDDDAADPEYNVMEDDEDLHDREEHRRDRAVKVPKKELNELVAELIEEYHVSSGDDLDLEGHDLSALTLLTPFINDSGIYSDVNGIEQLAPSGVLPETQNLIKDSNKNPTTSNSLENPVDVSVDAVDSCCGDGGEVNVEASTIPASTSYISEIVVDIAQNGGIANEINPSAQTTTTIITTEVESDPAIEEPLFREFDLKFLQYQMRQHIQLLAQSYVLTVSNEDSCLKNIAKTSQSMIIELKNFARCNGVGSNFAVCNLDSAWNLASFWPHKMIQQSPIKKKILEEKYLTESSVEERSVASHFPRHVVKIIAENLTFMYNHLLPDNYFMKNIDSRTRFTFGEDALIVGAIDEFKSLKISVTQMAEAISDVLLVVRPQVQVFHRIRNLRKSKQTCDPAIRKYFVEGIVPKPDRTIPEMDMISLLYRDTSGLSQQWLSLLRNVEDSSTFKWEEQLNKDPVTKLLSQKRNKAQSQKNRKMEVAKLTAVVSPQASINRAFPNGIIQITKPSSDVQGFPLFNPNGKTGAMIYVPKYALNPIQIQSPFKKRHLFEPQEGEEAGIELVYQEPRRANPTIIELSHLSHRSQESPEKISTVLLEDSIIENGIFPDRPSINNNHHVTSVTPTPLPVITAYQLTLSGCLPSHNVINIGKPFDLPELSTSVTPEKGIIDLASIQTPMKKVIFEKATAQSSSNDPFLDDTSCNVIEEGTEVELTEDDISDQEIDLKCHEQPELISLDSGDEDIKPVPSDAGGEGKANKSDSSPKKGDGGNTSTSSKAAHSSSNTVFTSVTSRRSQPRGGGRGDDSDEDNDRRPKKRSLPKDAKDVGTSKEDELESGEKDKPSQKRHSGGGKSSNDPHILGPPKTPISVSQQLSKKKVKRSPGNQGNRRVSKFNVTPAAKMVDEDVNDFDDVTDACMESYLVRVHSVTEAKNPGLYASFVQMLIEAGEKTVNQVELHMKVKALFKDYPQLLREFESFLDKSNIPPKVEDASNAVGSTANDETVAQIKFIQMLEKFTEHCPHLKAKVMNKLKSLKENKSLCEKDIVVALEPFFVGSPVMMNSFKALFPTIYQPHSVSSGMDFEEIDLDAEDHPRENSDDLHFETVKLPEEISVPATNTCPCTCHVNNSDSAFASRSKHCRKCSLKFQDGRIFIHNGKVLRPVSVELTPAPPKTITPIGPSARSCNASNHDRVKREPPSHSRAKEFKEPEACPAKQSTSSDKKLHGSSNLQHKAPICNKSTVLDDREGVRDEGVIKIEDTIKSVDTGDAVKSHKSHRQSTKQEISSEWTEAEDTIILSTCQQEPYLNLAYKKMATLIPLRSMEQIKSRCSELVAIIQSAGEDIHQ